MQPLNGTALGRVNRQGVVVGSLYSTTEVLAVLRTHREEVFRYELHRIVSGAWTVIADITNLVKESSGVIKYDRWAVNFMRSASFEIVDNSGLINFITDSIRCFHLVKMPDGNYVEWMKGTFFIPSPKKPLTFVSEHAIETQDALMLLANDKITDWFKVPSSNPHINGYPDGDPIGWVIQIISTALPYAGLAVGPDTSILVPDTAPKFYNPGTPKLDVVNDLLLYANYDQLRSDETNSFLSGPFVQPSARPLEFTYVADGKSVIIEGSGEKEQDLWHAPNQWLRYTTIPAGPAMRSRLTITDPTNPLATVNRGGMTITDAAAIEAPDQATLDGIVSRLYEEGQRVLQKVKVETPLMPHSHSDKIALQWTTAHPWAITVNGIYVLRSWTFPMVAGGRMTQNYELSALSFSVPAAAPSGYTTVGGSGSSISVGVVG